MSTMGLLLGLSLVIQIVTGVFLSIHYGGDTLIAFDSVRHIMRDVNRGWLLRIFHANGARLFFVCLFLHTGRGLYYMSFKYYETWIIGVTLLILTIATAFFRVCPPLGANILLRGYSDYQFVFGHSLNWRRNRKLDMRGICVGNPTLSRFYSLHFLL